MRTPLLSFFLLTPALALAVNYSDVSSDRYVDVVSFSTAEKAAINVLTNMDAVGGNPDGTFAPNRTLNRAEFLKIAFLSYPNIAVSVSDAEDCFPDVRSTDWFSRYVCLAKRRGAVGGYPDGFFRPGNPVNYVEAIKMLEELFGYSPEPVPGQPWYMPYVDDARVKAVLLPGGVGYGDFLTRGQMARLAAAFVAYSEGDLLNYRRAERGLSPIYSSSSSSSSSSSMTSSTSSSSSSSLPSSSVSSVTLYDFPARSRFLVAGERSKVIASATFFANLEPMIVKRAEVKLENEIEGIDSMYIVAADGTELGQIALDKVFDPTEKTWRGALTGNFRIEKGDQKVIGVEVRMKPRDQGGTSEEMVQVDSFKLSVEGEWTANSITTGTDAGPYPKHQTSMGRITSVTNAQESSGVLPLGPNSQLASFAITGSGVQGATLKVEHLTFNVSASPSITVTNWYLTIPGSTEHWPCSFNSGDLAVSCSSLPDSLGTLGTEARTFRLYGDVSLTGGATDKNMQISLSQAGNLDTNGSVRWTDGSGHFNWVELDEPLARSTRWQ